MALQLPRGAPLRAKQVNDAAREANIDSLLSTVESDDKSEYINRWLLQYDFLGLLFPVLAKILL
jgi:hypothetical protein